MIKKLQNLAIRLAYYLLLRQVTSDLAKNGYAHTVNGWWESVPNDIRFVNRGTVTKSESKRSIHEAAAVASLLEVICSKLYPSLAAEATKDSIDFPIKPKDK